jgi:hypothetical protein
MTLKSGETYKVTLEITPTEDIEKAVVNAAICNGLFDKAPIRSVKIGYYNLTDEEEVIHL